MSVHALARRTGAALLLSIGLSAPATAASLNADQILNQFGLVVFGDHSANSSVHGRAFVGGDLTGNSFTMGTNNYTIPASDFALLSVGGDVRSGSVNMLAGSTVDIGGGIRSGTHVNNASAVNTGVTGIDDVTAHFRALMLGTASHLAGLAQSATASVTDQAVRFDAAPAHGLTVYDVDAAFLNQRNNLELALAGTETVIINVSGRNLTLSQNFNTDMDLGRNVIWNFHEAETLTLGNRFVGQVLAPRATVSNGNNIHGALVANAFNQGGQMHVSAWGGTLPPPTPIPLPAPFLLLLGALAGLVLVARRRA